MAEVLSCQTLDQFKQNLEDGNSKKLTVINFTATWCAPCRFMAPILSEFANKYEDVLFFKVDVDELKTIAEDYKVHSLPTFVFLKDGKEVNRFVGANKETLLKLVTKHSGRSLPEADPAPST
ncbi:thioredoxin H5-like [Chenopodium quinoa]|uniref:Thioredoxin domain-containing protein n=1 Tax=Chenopodium quinoa TaxID=63459 RepID=A0A803LKG6_CHEQI|nr:thioredoxin H5-like [Chenopodium quinoa]